MVRIGGFMARIGGSKARIGGSKARIEGSKARIGGFEAKIEGDRVGDSEARGGLGWYPILKLCRFYDLSSFLIGISAQMHTKTIALKMLSYIQFCRHFVKGQVALQIVVSY